MQLLRIILVMLSVLVAPTQIVFGQRDLGEPFLFESANGRTMPYRLFTPPAAATAQEPLPLVLFLHGAGEQGTDNEAQVRYHISGLIAATQSEQFASYLLAPQTSSGWSADGQTDLTMDILQSLSQSLPIDTDRIYVTGLSMGGFGSFEYLRQFPNTFAAAVPMSGGGTPAAAETFRDVPIWMFHGDRDTTVSPEGSRTMYDALTAVGATPLLTEIASASHVMWDPVYRDTNFKAYGLYEWMFSQNRRTRPSYDLLVGTGDVWRYLDNGADPVDAWVTAAYDDASWPSGNAPFGFGHATESTTLACGPNSPDCDERHARYFFRHDFTAEDLEGVTSVLAQVRRDDGIVVYLNGQEVFRESNSRGSTFASSASVDDGYAAYRIDPSLLLEHNTLAVEVRQARSRVDTDLNFDLLLVAERVPEPTSTCTLLYLLAVPWLAVARRTGAA